MRILNLLMIALMFVGCEKKDNKAPETNSDNVLNIAVSSDYPPFIYNENGKLGGFEVELINAIAKKLGKTVHFHDVDFKDIIKTVVKKQVDFAIAAIGKTEDRAKEVDFSMPYHRSMSVIVTSIASTVNKVEDLNGKTLGFETGTTYEKYFGDKKDSEFNGVNKLERHKFADLVKAMDEGKCHAILTGYSEAYEMQNSNPDLKVIPINETIMTFSIAVPKGAPLLKQINEMLDAMIKNGEIAKLEKQYFKKVVEED
ncbi:MAG: transporter substrate-binding domain-containing protein [Proteobacteria bacterium]|nr:transporter substrate-binding domain-containing protein [Pseudomonadota bacterium]